MEFIHDIPSKKDLKSEKKCLIYQKTLILNYKVQPTYRVSQKTY